MLTECRDAEVMLRSAPWFLPLPARSQTSRGPVMRSSGPGRPRQLSSARSPSQGGGCVSNTVFC